MSTTTTHILRTPRGAVRLEIAETIDTVFAFFSGAQLTEAEIPAFLDWVWPIIDAYQGDPRPFEFSSEHVNWMGCAEQLNGLWRTYYKPRGTTQ